MLSELTVQPVGEHDLTLQGPLTFETAMAAMNELGHYIAYRERVRINLRGVTHADSAALAVMLESTKLAKREHCHLTFFELPSSIQVLVKVAKLDTIVPLEQ